MAVSASATTPLRTPDTTPRQSPVVTATPLAATPSTVAVTVKADPEPHDYMGDLTSGGIGHMGALIGAYAAYRCGLKAAREAREHDRKERDQALSFAVVHKLNRIYGALKEMRLQIQRGQVRMSERANKPHPAFTAPPGVRAVLVNHLSMEVPPTGNLPDRIHFAPEEVAGAGRVGGGDALQKLMILDDRYNAAIDVLTLYRDLRRSLTARVKEVFAGQGEYDGKYLSHAWTEEQYKALRPDLGEMDGLLLRQLENVTTDERDAFQALQNVLQGKANTEDEVGPFNITDPDGKIITITRQSTPKRS